jgi:hypothetical protein
VEQHQRLDLVERLDPRRDQPGLQRQRREQDQVVAREARDRDLLRQDQDEEEARGEDAGPRVLDAEPEELGPDDAERAGRARQAQRERDGPLVQRVSGRRDRPSR